MRNNEDRLGTKKANSDSPATTATQGGLAPLDFVRPTTVVSLPSEGKFYGEDHPLHNQETIEIRQMTTAEEEILTNRSLLQKGLALDKFLERLLVDTKVKPSDLVVGDKNALLIQARIDGYGADYTTKVVCPSCTATQKHTFDLNEVVSTTGKTVPDGVTSTANGHYSMELDNGWIVEFRALTGADEKKMVQSTTNKKKAGIEATPIQDQLRALIVSISGHTDSATINKAIQHLTGKQSRAIRTAYADTIPNVEMRGEINCNECGTTSEMEVPLTADFFWART